MPNHYVGFAFLDEASASRVLGLLHERGLLLSDGMYLSVRSPDAYVVSEALQEDEEREYRRARAAGALT